MSSKTPKVCLQSLVWQHGKDKLMKALVTHLYSNPYSNADEKLRTLAVRSEHQIQE
jgi:hypothetical protein